jgi:hypothetical protein
MAVVTIISVIVATETMHQDLEPEPKAMAAQL